MTAQMPCWAPLISRPSGLHSEYGSGVCPGSDLLPRSLWCFLRDNSAAGALRIWGRALGDGTEEVNSVAQGRRAEAYLSKLCLSSCCTTWAPTDAEDNKICRAGIPSSLPSLDKLLMLSVHEQMIVHSWGSGVFCVLFLK